MPDLFTLSPHVLSCSKHRVLPSVSPLPLSWCTLPSWKSWSATCHTFEQCVNLDIHSFLDRKRLRGCQKTVFDGPFPVSVLPRQSQSMLCNLVIDWLQAQDARYNLQVVAKSERAKPHAQHNWVKVVGCKILFKHRDLREVCHRHTTPFPYIWPTCKQGSVETIT